MSEMKSLTLNGTKYDSFVDQTARDAIKKIEQNGAESDTPNEQTPTNEINLTDRTTGVVYRLYVDKGKLTMEQSEV